MKTALHNSGDSASVRPYLQEALGSPQDNIDDVLRRLQNVSTTQVDS
jgi:hypothetical protein